MYQISTLENTNFNTYDFLPEYGWNYLLVNPVYIPLHGPFSNDSSIEIQRGNLSVQ